MYRSPQRESPCLCPFCRPRGKFSGARTRPGEPSRVFYTQPLSTSLFRSSRVKRLVTAQIKELCLCTARNCQDVPVSQCFVREPTKRTTGISSRNQCEAGYASNAVLLAVKGLQSPLEWRVYLPQGRKSRREDDCTLYGLPRMPPRPLGGLGSPYRPRIGEPPGQLVCNTNLRRGNNAATMGARRTGHPKTEGCSRFYQTPQVGPRGTTDQVFPMRRIWRQPS